MNKTLKLFLAALLAVIILIIYIDSETKKPVDWSPNYSLDTKNPLDLYVFNHEVEKLFPTNFKRVTKTPFEYFSDHTGNANFMLIKENVYEEIDSLLLSKIKNGSNLWISTETFIKYFEDTLKLNYTDIAPNINLKRNDTVILTLTMSNWNNEKFFLNPVQNSYAFSKLDASSTTILGRMSVPSGHTFPNYIKVKYGKGNIYLHNQPAVFSNYALLKDKNSADYVAHILSYIPRDRPLVWFVKNQTVNTDGPVNESILSVIFRYPALRMTWLLFLYGMLLFIVFNTKRRQRIIPVIKEPKNTTTEFVQTIGNLYFQEGETSNIIDKKIIYFLDQIRQNYYLDTRKTDDSFIDKLQNKSGKDRELIVWIVTFITKFEKNKTSERKDLQLLSSKIDEFWKE